MAQYDYDLFTIGGGSGGVRASRMSASFGARVVLAEERYLGGTCVNVGCIPKKLLVYASHFAEDFADAGSYGWSVGESGFDWNALIAAKDREIARLNGVYDRLLNDAGVEQITGHATLVDAHTVAVGDQRFTAENILVATGSWPSVPRIPGIEHSITSNEAFSLKALPERVIIVGGGYIAVEFAGIFHGLGVETTELYRGPLFMRGFDDDVRKVLSEEMRKKGVDLRFEITLDKIVRTDSGLVATLSDDSSPEADEIMYATGRLPLTADLGLEQVGVELDEKGAVVVDEYSRSSLEHIWAVGDATDRINLTPVAIHEGMCLANTLFNDNPMKPCHEDVASAVFSQPSIGTVGLTEARARERYAEIDVYKSRFRPLKHTLTSSDETTFMKLIVDKRSDRVVGFHVVGADAGEMTQGVAVAIKCGATKAQFDATIGIHPTSAEEFVTMREPEPAIDA
jgi:glutathione reductase (NADPH)